MTNFPSQSGPLLSDMKTDDYLRMARSTLYGNYKPAPFVLERGLGSQLWDLDGKRYLDLCAGVAVCSVGHAHPRYVADVTKQLGRLGHVSNWFYNRVNIELAQKLTSLSQMDRALFCNSGAEANEALFKMARRYFWAQGKPEKKEIIAFHGAFHGRTMGALSMTGTPKYREGFGEVLGVKHVPYGNLNEVKAAFSERTAAIILEPILGEGGVLCAPKTFLRDVEKLARDHGALFLLDEVQTGIGRLGTMFGFQHEEWGPLKPDAVALAKGLGGGFPIGAVLTTEALGGALPPGTHGSTYGGNPLACAAALSVLTILEEENLVSLASQKGLKLRLLLDEVVHDFPHIAVEARGLGLLIGLELSPPLVAREVVSKLFERGVLVIAAGEHTLRFCPPLVIKESELEEGIAMLRDVFTKLST